MYRCVCVEEYAWGAREQPWVLFSPVVYFGFKTGSLTDPDLDDWAMSF